MLISALALLFFSSCKDEPSLPPGVGNYTEGVFVVNEGPFGGSGSITWINPEDSIVVEDVFSRANGGAKLGSFVQSLTLHQNKAYVVVNGANRIYVLDARTFQYLDTIGGLELPRFFHPVNEEIAYVSQWGADGLTGSLAKVDLNTNKVVATIPTGAGPEKMLQNGNQLYVANSGGYGLDSTLSIINLDTDTEIDRPVVAGRNPSCLLSNLSNDGLIYILSKGYFLDLQPEGTLEELASGGATAQALPAYADDLCKSPGGDLAYFTAGNAIYQFRSGQSAQAIFSQSAYGLNCHPINGSLYCTDAKDFNSKGELLIYNPSGNKIAQFPVGIAPGEIVFIQ